MGIVNESGLFLLPGFDGHHSKMTVSPDVYPCFSCHQMFTPVFHVTRCLPRFFMSPDIYPLFFMSPDVYPCFSCHQRCLPQFFIKLTNLSLLLTSQSIVSITRTVTAIFSYILYIYSILYLNLHTILKCYIEESDFVVSICSFNSIYSNVSVIFQFLPP